MLLEIKRINDDGDSTIGLLYADGKFICFTLEDQYQEEKVMHETRIPAGVYAIGWQKAETKMTLRYRKKYPWFHYHIHIQNIPDFSGVYIHSGNTDDHTSGCPLVGDTLVNNTVDEGKVYSSAQAFERLYKLLRPFLDKDSEVKIKITDEEIK